MKECTYCFVVKSQEEFRIIGKYRQACCKLCERAYTKNIQWRNQSIIQAVKELSGCADCGVHDKPYLMDFDHLSNKKFNLAKASCVSIKTLFCEIQKGQFVCVRCHRVRTYKRLQEAA